MFNSSRFNSLRYNFSQCKYEPSSNTEECSNFQFNIAKGHNLYAMTIKYADFVLQFKNELKTDYSFISEINVFVNGIFKQIYIYDKIQPMKEFIELKKLCPKSIFDTDTFITATREMINICITIFYNDDKRHNPSLIICKYEN